ncbi:MAG: sensor domain-containing diguanylate cyclase [Pseudomonadota bacterium]
MGNFVQRAKTAKSAGVSTALIALIVFGGLQICFLALDAVFQFPHWVMMTEAAAALGVTVLCVALVARAEKRADEADATAESQLTHLADFATDLYWETDLEGIIIAAGGRLMTTIFPDMNRVLGQHYLDVIHLEETEMEKMLTALQAVKPYSDILSKLNDPQGKRYFISLSATPRFNAAGDVVGYLGVGTNVTRRIEAQGRLRHMAEHDMLTGLANRYAFQNRIENDVSDSDDDDNVALLAIDLDNFKAINDTYGHQAGDALLGKVAKRIRQTVRGRDWAARLGGDEFVVVTHDVANPMDACLMAARLITALSRPYQIGGLELHCTASVGVACAPIHARNARTLMKCADLALYEAKGDGRSCYRLFETPGAGGVALN